MLNPTESWTIQHSGSSLAPKVMEFSAGCFGRYNIWVRYAEPAQVVPFLTAGMLKARRDGWVTIIPDPYAPPGSIELKNQGVSLGYAKSIDFTGVPVVTSIVGEDGTVAISATPSQWIRGTGVPLNTLGTNGQYYEDIPTGQVYYKSAGVWALTNIHGTQGPEIQVDFTDNSTTDIIVGNAALNRAVFLDYTLEIIGRYEVGRIAVVHDGTNANLDVTSTPTSPPRIVGITYSSALSGTDIVLSITAASVGSILRFKYRKVDYISPTV